MNHNTPAPSCRLATDMQIGFPFTLLAAFVAIFVLLGSTTAAASVQATPSAPDYSPASRFSGEQKVRKVILRDAHIAGTAIQGTASYSIANQSVSFSWAWETNGPRPKQHSTQVESLSFWPTDVVSVSPGKVAVAGRRNNGNTVVELWEFGRSKIPKATVDAAGNWEYPELDIKISARKTIYDAAVPGRTLIRSLLARRVSDSTLEASVLAIFDDSSELWQLDLRQDGTTSASRLYSPIAGSGVPQIAGLSCFCASHWSANHPIYGYVHVLTNEPNTPDQCATIVLVDRNRDGVIDPEGVFTPDKALWESMRFGHAEEYIEFY